ncbi:hypothetical protein E2562_014714 [Oryza meyeriana var. granulata]|uniref:Uncharacterized protein n=1 Tax=Oryza meyeriana var. granulata TaxID=110450 RepID=A0A6G1BL76_9ORYZ|nr:hypothetical protein E2562_014714 [Oryza meyeriana var. granulata]
MRKFYDSKAPPSIIGDLEILDVIREQLINDDMEEVFDAIICDPPYGVRAGGRKSSTLSTPTSS